MSEANYEFDDIDRALIAKCRAGIEASDEDGSPIRDYLDEDDLIEAAILLLKVLDSQTGEAP